MIELAKAAAPFDALYTTHMRNEGERLLEAVEESLTIGRESGVHLHISHHKSAGPANWGKVKDSLVRVEEALASGQRVTLDVYPYTAGSGRMVEYFDLDNPSRALAEVIRIASCPAFRDYEGRMLTEIAEEQGLDLIEVVRQILTAPKGDSRHRNRYGNLRRSKTGTRWNSSGGSQRPDRVPERFPHRDRYRQNAAIPTTGLW